MIIQICACSVIQFEMESCIQVYLFPTLYTVWTKYSGCTIVNFDKTDMRTILLAESDSMYKFTCIYPF